MRMLSKMWYDTTLEGEYEFFETALQFMNQPRRGGGAQPGVSVAVKRQAQPRAWNDINPPRGFS